MGINRNNRNTLFLKLLRTQLQKLAVAAQVLLVATAIALKYSFKRLARKRPGLEAALKQPFAWGRPLPHLPAVPVRSARSL